MKAAIIGTGRLGGMIGEELIRRDLFEEVWLWNRSKDKLTGMTLSLNLFARLLGRSVRVEIVDWSRLSEVDIVVVVIKERYDPRSLVGDQTLPSWFPRDMKYIGFLADYPLLLDVGERLQGFRGIVAVVTNPVDVVSTILQLRAPDALVAGLGLSVDAGRLAFVMSRRLPGLRGVDVPLGGEHGSGLVPLRTLWASKFLRKAGDDVIDAFLNEARDVRETVMWNLGFTLFECGFSFGNDIEWLVGEHANAGSRTYSVWDETACIGWPVKHTAGTVGGLSKVESISDQERREIRLQRDRVARLYDRLVAYAENIVSGSQLESSAKRIPNLPKWRN